MLDSFTSPDPTSTVTLTVPDVLAAVTEQGAAPVHLTVAADGWLVGHYCGEGDRLPVVTEWIGRGSGRSKGHPEAWEQKYRRAFKTDEAAERRVAELLEKHGGKAGDQS